MNDIPPKKTLSKRKFFLFAITPAVLLVGLIVAVEGVVRLAQLDEPSLRSPFVTPGFESIHRDDAELFFSLKPDLRVRWQDAEVVTNSLGLRCAEVGTKQPGEFRILSLGESTTFGALVENDETYSAVLERLLQEKADGRSTYRVINAGVSVYSSFQSLKYLETRGLELQPDLVLFYHEINDFLPSSVRESESPGETGLALTDRQLYESKRHWLHRKMLGWSALYRLVTLYQSRQRLADNQLHGPASPKTVGNARIPVEFFLVATREGDRPLKLPARVTIEERKDNLNRLWSVCQQRGIQLVIIHPSYAESTRHECELTEFCQSENVPMLDAYDSLHPEGAHTEEYYLDLWHPTPLGHRALARALFDFLVESGMVQE